MSARVCARRLTENHLNNLFPPLKFPDELSIRLLTHGSHKSATSGHNSRFSFIGRRVLESYLLVFLQSSPSLNHTHDLDLIASRTLNTHILGEHVAPQWDLGRVLRWAPPVPANTLNLRNNATSTELHPATARSVGLYKVLGEAVQAVVGGVFHQFGGATAHRVFHTRVLPHILLPKRADGLLDVFHDDALRACERFRAAQGDADADGVLVVDGGGERTEHNNNPTT